MPTDALSPTERPGTLWQEIRLENTALYRNFLIFHLIPFLLYFILFKICGCLLYSRSGCTHCKEKTDSAFLKFTAQWRSSKEETNTMKGSLFDGKSQKQQSHPVTELKKTLLRVKVKEISPIILALQTLIHMPLLRNPVISDKGKSND